MLQSEPQLLIIQKPACLYQGLDCHICRRLMSQKIACLILGSRQIRSVTSGQGLALRVGRVGLGLQSRCGARLGWVSLLLR